MAKLPQRQQLYLEAVRDKKTPEQIAREWGTSRQNVDNTRRALIRKGLIHRRDGVPRWMKYAKKYPLQIVSKEVQQSRVLLPPEATLRELHPRESLIGLTLEPITVVKWPAQQLTVQGIPVIRPDLKRIRVAQPEHRIVWAVHDDGRQWVFAANRLRMWAESHTVQEFIRNPGAPTWGGDEEAVRNLTLVVAAAVGVEAALDLTGGDE